MIQKTVFITGTSSGFGQLTVARLLEGGHRVIAGLRGGDERGRKIFAAFASRFGTDLRFLDLELNDSSRLLDNLLTLETILRESFGNRLDAIIMNAGYGLFGAIEDTTEAQLRQQFEVNFFSVTTVVRHLLPRLRESGGKILLLSSVAGRFTFPFYGCYSASKFALEAWAEGLHYDLRMAPEGLGKKVQVCLIEPGGYATAFNQNLTQSQRPGSPYAENLARLIRFLGSPQRKAGDPEIIARLLVRFVAQPKIPLRKLMGNDAKMVRAISCLIPSLWRVRLTELFYRKLIFKI